MAGSLGAPEFDRTGPRQPLQRRDDARREHPLRLRTVAHDASRQRHRAAQAVATRRDTGAALDGVGRPIALSCYVVARIEQGVERFKDTRCVLLFHGLIPVTTPNARLWWEAPRRSRFAAPLFVNPVVDVQRTMDETDTCCLTHAKKAHHFDVH